MNNKRPPRNEEKAKNFSLTIKKLLKDIKGYLVFIIIATLLAVVSCIFSIIGPDKLSDLTNELSKGLVINREGIEKITTDISSSFSEDNMKKVIPMIMADQSIPMEDKMVLSQDPKNINIKDVNKDILKYLLPESKIDNVKITTEDKIIFLSEMSGITKDSSAKEIYKKLDKMPKSISSLIKPKVNIENIKKISFYLLIIYILSGLFNFLNSYIMTIVSNGYSKNLRTNISLKINRLALKYFDNHQIGDTLSRMTNDVDTVGMSLSQSLGSLVAAITLFLGSMFMMFKTNWIMAVTAIVSSLFGFVFMSLVLSKSQKYFTQRQKELGKLNGHIEEIYTNHNVVKAYNGENAASKKFDKLNDNVYECNRKSQFLSGLMPSMMHFIGNFGYVCVCIVGAMLVINNKTSFGTIVAFMIYIRLFTSPLSQIAQGMTSMQSTAAAAERVFEFMEEEEMDDERDLTKKLDPKKVSGNIEFKHVKFGYNDNKTIIKDFSANVKPGQKIAIVGPTGAGKTTIVNLLMKFYNIKDGDILIDGVSIHDLTRENIHDLFIMVLQDTWLFDGTIRDNVKYKSKASDKRIMEALETVGVDHFVKSLPGTLDYNIKNDGSVSQGQKQLLTIARGMIKDAPLLILDEATSSVDTRTEELVQKAMDKLTKGRTSFIIAHRLSTIKNADLILVMKDGSIIEQGNHNELMKKNGFYAELYNSQFKN